jgi:fructokinase
MLGALSYCESIYRVSLSPRAMTPTVICLGECLIDRIFDRYDGDRPEQPFWMDLPGGAPANVATGLAKLGTAVGLIGCLGSDAQADHLESVLMAAGVDCSSLQRSPTAPTRVVLVRRDAQGERSFVGFSRPDPSQFADAELDPDQISPDWFETADFLVMGTLGLAYPHLGQSMHKALAWAHDHGVITVVDLNWRPGFWPQPELAADIIKAFVDQVDILKLNHTEAEWLFQTAQAEAILPALNRAKAVLVTAGDAGCDYATATGQGHVPAFPVDCEDTTGAGDSFLAGFVHQLCQQGLALLDDEDQLRSALRYASATGALTTTQPGAMAAQPDARAVEAFLYLHQL